ncbi:hypothetical protein DX933_08370 [Ornithinibacillus gellani]|uniref:hypothetical protein n=1 Tax=Ornithinibacillus gellani TaxID=2293253 RepID=UPI000F4AAE72|nr:hypothetical protein [Ornithinibacillus gellani]TQS74785.1 hypothetical protein DX933_08370 [Ornithinibacillus gellani]
MKAGITGLVRDIFIICVFFLCMFYGFMEVVHFNFIASCFVLLFVSTLAIVISRYIDHQLQDYRFAMPARLLTIVAILVFFSYQIFTPYFYSTSSLETEAKDQIEYLSLLQDDTLDQAEQNIIMEHTFTADMVQTFAMMKQVPRLDWTEPVLEQVNRKMNQFDVTIHVNHSDEKFIITFKREAGVFKVDGWLTMP